MALTRERSVGARFDGRKLWPQNLNEQMHLVSPGTYSMGQ
jgi:hypothetical protein